MTVLEIVKLIRIKRDIYSSNSPVVYSVLNEILREVYEQEFYDNLKEKNERNI